MWYLEDFLNIQEREFSVLTILILEEQLQVPDVTALAPQNERCAGAGFARLLQPPEIPIPLLT